MLRRSKDPYVDRKVRKRFARLAQEPLVRVMLSDIGAIDPQGESLARPCGDEEKYPEKCGPGPEGGSEGSGALTGQDLLLIHDQARLQHADSPEQIQGLTDAWNAAKGAIYTKPEIFSDPETTEQLALQLGTLIEPRNKGRYRHVPATFGPGKPPAVDPDTVPRAMQQLWMAYSEQLLEPDEWYHEFEKVHPLEDGNGRLGDLMWKIAKVRKGEEWPNTHPPDLFGTDESQFSAEKNKG